MSGEALWGFSKQVSFISLLQVSSDTHAMLAFVDASMDTQHEFTESSCICRHSLLHVLGVACLRHPGCPCRIAACRGVALKQKNRMVVTEARAYILVGITCTAQEALQLLICLLCPASGQVSSVGLLGGFLEFQCASCTRTAVAVLCMLIMKAAWQLIALFVPTCTRFLLTCWFARSR